MALLASAAIAASAACQQGAAPAPAPAPAPPLTTGDDARPDRALPPPLQTFANLIAHAPDARDRITAAIAVESIAPPAEALRILRPALADPSPPVRLAAIAYVARLASRVDLQPSIRYELGDGLVDALAASPAERDAAYAVLLRVSGQDFAPGNREAWRTWLAPPAALDPPVPAAAPPAPSAPAATDG